MPPSQSREPDVSRPFWGLVVFPVLGGASAALVEQNLVIGAAVYYGLLAMALASPQAAPLRRAVFAPLARSNGLPAREGDEG